MKAVTEPASRWSALLSVLANWRDWNIPVKLAAVTLVPAVFAVVLGTMQIADQVDEASAYRRVDRLVVVNDKLRELVTALQTERATAGVLLAARAGDVGSQLADERGATNRARTEFLRAAGRVALDHEAGAARYADVLTWLRELADVREQVGRPGFDAANAVTRYSAVVDALLRFDRTMSAEALDPTLASTSSALHDLEEIKEEIAYQQALVAVGIVRGGLTGPEVDALAGSSSRQADRLADFHAVAGVRGRRLYDQKLSGTGVASRNNVVAAVIERPAGAPVPTNAQAWHDASTLTTNRLTEVTGVLGADLHLRSTALQDAASDGAGLAAVILLVALVVALAVMFVVGRQLLGSLAALRRGALVVAERALPDAVARIRDGGEEAGDIELPPVRVTSMDEVGQVARAFDAVQRQALKLATEQAVLRARYAGVFVNLSRRSQGLVQRQLQLLERLERAEEDPDQLATLFQLDHLATRMRRNNENLMVLSGGEVSRRSQRPAAIADVLRASISEIEQYQRVVLLPPPSVEVVGYAVGDLVRLISELLDNATAFSAPDTRVTIASHAFEDGSLCVTVHDEGIGMHQDEIDEANAKLADAATVDVSTTRRMGLFVVGRLAGRHGVEVRLNGGQDVPGVRATVTVPADLIIRARHDTPAAEPERAKKAPNGTSLLAPFSLSGQANGEPVNGADGHSNGHTNGVLRSGLTPSSPPPEEPGDGKPPPPLPRRGSGRKARPAQEPARGLFTPAREVDDTDRSAVEETTPIFDEMASAWFRAVTGPPVPAPAPTRPRPPRQDDQQSGGHAWNFAADSGFDTARAVSKAQPSDFTSGGLPRRSPRQHLVPGSAAPDAPAGPPGRGRDADDIRDRLSDYRHAVRRARDHRHGAEPSPTPSAAPVIPSRPSTSDIAGSGLAGRRFAADIGWRAANEVSASTPVDFTASGLPRRSPRQNLVPGSVSAAGGVSASEAAGPVPRPARAEETRGRLGSFQNGLSRGRRSLADRSTGVREQPQQQQESE